MPRVLLLLAALLFPGTLCAFWPVSWELDGATHFLGPLVSYENDGGAKHFTVRPLLSSYDPPHDYTLLFPLGKGTEEKSYFFPFYSRHKGERDHDFSLFPFFYGETEEGKSYGGVFPFYGKFYNRFKRDEIGFFLWPLYGYSRGDDATRTNVLWPLFSFYSGHQEGFKIGPLYGQRRWGDCVGSSGECRGLERESAFVLWPFFIKDSRGLDTDEPVRSLWAIPFYMQTESPHSSFHAVLWPFFTHSRVKDRTEVNAPWPVFSYISGGKEEGVGVWPLYSRYRKEKDETTHVLWPVYKGADKYRADDTKWTERRILLLNKYTDDNRGKFLNVWPFFEYRSAEENRNFYFPSLLPWRNKDYDRIVRPMITLYEYRRADEKVISNFLYGLYTSEKKGESRKWRFAFLVEVKRSPEGAGFQILSGLFGVDDTHIKVFYIPIRRAPDAAMAAEHDADAATVHDAAAVQGAGADDGDAETVAGIPEETTCRE
jgi:hypothetical protein